MKKLIPLIILTLLSCRETVKITDTAPEKCIIKEEICNGIDDDCDKIIDNPELVGIKPCYSGNSNDLLYGACRFGVERCVNGAWVCSGEVKPKAEICNGIDDNCNGQIDEIKGTGLDILFVIDYSPSMTDKINMINDILLDWSASYANRTDINVGLIGAPDDNPSHDRQVVKMLPLSNIPTFIAATRSHAYAQGGGGEPTLDAIYFLADRRNPLNINWTQDYARAIFVFTDEGPQSYTSPMLSVINTMNMYVSSNVNVFIFTNEPSWSGWITFLINSKENLSTSIDQAIVRGMCK